MQLKSFLILLCASELNSFTEGYDVMLTSVRINKDKRELFDEADHPHCPENVRYVCKNIFFVVVVVIQTLFFPLYIFFHLFYQPESSVLIFSLSWDTQEAVGHDQHIFLHIFCTFSLDFASRLQITRKKSSILLFKNPLCAIIKKYKR